MANVHEHTLSAFLLARIAEDEEVAVLTREKSWEVYPLPDAAPNRWTMTGVGVAGDEMGHRTETMFHSDAVHIARHDPARVLAECEAKRRLVELRYSWNLQAERAPEPPFGPILKAQVVTADTILRTLAAVYADHPDYPAAESG